VNLKLHPTANAQVLLAIKKSDEPLLAAPLSEPDPYLDRGCHPDIVERLWDQLGANYSREARCLIYGRPALVDPTSGIIVAVGYGTRYAIRIPISAVSDAIKLGAARLVRWSNQEETDIESKFGQGWVCGAWLDQETAWIQKACEEITRKSGPNDGSFI
jgi:hypothetical protein